eukprot:6454734-Amphidinium_carterae.3
MDVFLVPAIADGSLRQTLPEDVYPLDPLVWIVRQASSSYSTLRRTTAQLRRMYEDVDNDRRFDTLADHNVRVSKLVYDLQRMLLGSFHVHVDQCVPDSAMHFSPTLQTNCIAIARGNIPVHSAVHNYTNIKNNIGSSFDVNHQNHVISFAHYCRCHLSVYRGVAADADIGQRELTVVPHHYNLDTSSICRLILGNEEQTDRVGQSSPGTMRTCLRQTAQRGERLKVFDLMSLSPDRRFFSV